MEFHLNPLISEHRPQYMYEHGIHNGKPIDNLLGVRKVLLVEYEQKLHEELLELPVVIHIPHFLGVLGEEDLEVWVQYIVSQIHQEHWVGFAIYLYLAAQAEQV